MPDQNQGIPSDKLQDILGLLGGSGTATAALKAIVPSLAALKLKNQFGTPNFDPKMVQALERQGANIMPEGVHMNVTRHQNPLQANKPVMGGGVFYTPAGAGRPNSSSVHIENSYRSPEMSQAMRGYTLLRNPLMVNSQWNGPLPQNALAEMLPYGHQPIVSDAKAAQRAFSALGRRDDIDAFLLDRVGAGNFNLPPEKLLKANQENIVPWLLQNAAANEARKRGFDSILGYSNARNAFRNNNVMNPKMNELFDLRESRYPSPEGDYTLWPQYKMKTGTFNLDKE